jgi:hypothetical protein
MDLLETLLPAEPIEALFLWTSMEAVSGLCMTFELLHIEPEQYFIFLHFLLVSSSDWS